DDLPRHVVVGPAVVSEKRRRREHTAGADQEHQLARQLASPLSECAFFGWRRGEDSRGRAPASVCAAASRTDRNPKPCRPPPPALTLLLASPRNKSIPVESVVSPRWLRRDRGAQARREAEVAARP